MGKTILILNGSPRKNGNTSALVEAFARGAEEGGSKVVPVFLGDMTIHGCKGCFGGREKSRQPLRTEGRYGETIPCLPASGCGGPGQPPLLLVHQRDS